MSVLWFLSDPLIAGLCHALCFLVPWRVRIIPHADGTRPLIRQFLLWRGDGWFKSDGEMFRKTRTYYLQHFITPEPVEWYHRHRWESTWSLILSGRFIEERRNFFGSWFKGHERWTSYEMDRATIHRVHEWGKLCWTLFGVEGATDDWGYYPWHRDGLGPFVPWRKHVQKKVPSLETGRLT